MVYFIPTFHSKPCLLTSDWRHHEARLDKAQLCIGSKDNGVARFVSFKYGACETDIQFELSQL